jgi:hypothetical protein
MSYPHRCKQGLPGRCKACEVEHAADRRVAYEVTLERKQEVEREVEQGGNFRFVVWGGLADLRLWVPR